MSALAPSSPAPPPKPDPASLTAAEQMLLAAWRECRDQARHCRSLHRQMLALRPQLAQLLIAKHHELAIPGAQGLFSRFLRSIHLPRRTAYDLLVQYAPKNPQTDWIKYSTFFNLNCADEKHGIGVPKPVFTLNRNRVRVHFTPMQAALVFLRLDASLPQPHQWRGGRYPCSPANAVARVCADAVTDPVVRRRLAHLSDCPEAELPAFSPFSRPFVIFSGPPAAY